MSFRTKRTAYRSHNYHIIIFFLSSAPKVKLPTKVFTYSMPSESQPVVAHIFLEQQISKRSTGCLLSPQDIHSEEGTMASQRDDPKTQVHNAQNWQLLHGKLTTVMREKDLPGGTHGPLSTGCGQSFNEPCSQLGSADWLESKSWTMGAIA